MTDFEHNHSLHSQILSLRDTEYNDTQIEVAYDLDRIEILG